MEVFLIGIVLLVIVMTWGVWIIWSISILDFFSQEVSIPILVIFLTIWTIQKHPIFRKLLLLILSMSIIVSVLEHMEFFYINLINLFGLYALYKFSLVQDMKFYFKDTYKISYKEAKRKQDIEKVTNFVAKKGAGQLLNHFILPGAGSLLMYTLDKKINKKLNDMNLFNNKDTNEAIILIEAIEKKAMQFRYKIMSLYLFGALGLMYSGKNFTVHDYLYLFNPLRGVAQIELLLFPSEKETIAYAILKVPVQEKVAMINNMQSINSASSEIKEMIPDITKYLLTINVVPSNARVRIMNIKPKYYDGIKLKQGKYYIEVSKRGYKTITKWINLNKDRNLNIKLDKV